MTNKIENVINKTKSNWSKDQIIRYLYIKLAPFFKRDLNYFLATDDEKYRQYKMGFINRGHEIVCSTISDYYVKLFNEFGINAKKVAANSAKIPLFVVLVEGNNCWYYIDPLNDLFNNQYGLEPTEFGILPSYNTLKQYHLKQLSKEYIKEIDEEIGISKPLDEYFKELHKLMTERNHTFDYFELERGDYLSLFQKKMDFINSELINLGEVNGEFERICLYLFLERTLFFKNEKSFILIKLNKYDNQYYPTIQYFNHNYNNSILYREEKNADKFVLIRK